MVFTPVSKSKLIFSCDHFYCGSTFGITLWQRLSKVTAWMYGVAALKLQCFTSAWRECMLDEAIWVPQSICLPCYDYWLYVFLIEWNKNNCIELMWITSRQDSYECLTFPYYTVFMLAWCKSKKFLKKQE